MIMLSSGGVAREKAGEAGIRSVIYKPVRRFQLYDTLSSIMPEPQTVSGGEGGKEGNPSAGQGPAR